MAGYLKGKTIGDTPIFNSFMIMGGRVMFLC